MRGGHPNYCIAEIGQSTEKRHGKLRRLAVTRTPVENYQLTLVWKTLIILLLESFSDQRWLLFFHWSLSDSKSTQVFRALLSILTDLNNAVFWTVTTCLVISKSSSPCINPLVTVPRALITFGIIVTFMFHSFFNSQVRSRHLSLFSHSFNSNLWPAGTANSIILQVLFSFLFFVDY